VITRLGHKDNVVAQKAAYLISKNTKKSVCVIAGIHMDNITGEEIKQVLVNVNGLVEEFLHVK
jgi:FixJ family two-component response regulator